jgi:hypothetical protein
VLVRVASSLLGSQCSLLASTARAETGGADGAVIVLSSVLIGWFG